MSAATSNTRNQGRLVRRVKRGTSPLGLRNEVEIRRCSSAISSAVGRSSK